MTIMRRLISFFPNIFICCLIFVTTYLLYFNYGRTKIIYVGFNSYLGSNEKNIAIPQSLSSPGVSPNMPGFNTTEILTKVNESSSGNTTSSTNTNTTTTTTTIATKKTPITTTTATITTTTKKTPNATTTATVTTTTKNTPVTTTTATTTTTTKKTTITTTTAATTTPKKEGRSCLIPKLLVDDPEIKVHLVDWGPMKCSPTKNWVYTANGKFYIDDEAVKNYTLVTCDYYDIIRVDDLYHKEELHPNFKNGSDILGDGFKVFCKGYDADTKEVNYTNFHFGVPKISYLHDAQPPKRDHLINSHVLMYLFDSLSRINFIRKLPKFYQLLTKELGAIVLEGFNIVGDGTPWALIPMTTGYFQPELPESRKRFWNATYLDEWPFIWRDFHNAGFATSYVEEQPRWSAFSYKIRGFNEKPVDHYLRTALLVADVDEANYYCIGDTPKSIVWVKYWKELLSVYDKINRKTFSLLFSSVTSHESYNYVQSLDEHMVTHFRQLYNEGFFKNTFLFVLGDHGRRFGPVRQTQSGRLEEKLPFLAIVPPPWFKKKYWKSYENLRNNKDALVTPFDIHATLKHLIEFKDDGEKGDLRDRGISLFKEIPLTRTCKHASIKPHFCSCLDWQKIDNLNNATLLNITYFVLDRFNQMLNDAKGLCATLTLKKLHSARILKPNDDLLSFVESADFDNISGNLSGSKTLSSAIYQIRFTTSPNDGIYDVSVTHFINLNQYLLNMDDVSRLNEYGNQPKCIYQTQHHLRQYCYCKH